MKNKVVLYIVLVSIIVMVFTGILYIRTFVYPVKYKEQIMQYSNKNNLDPYLTIAVINAESNFKTDATSNKEAKGLMQITQATAEEVNQVTNSATTIDDTTIYAPDVNIEIGCNYLASLIKRYNGNYYLAICAYNAGIGNVNKWLEEGHISEILDTTDVELPFKETTKYLKNVINNYKIYKALYKNL